MMRRCWLATLTAAVILQSLSEAREVLYRATLDLRVNWVNPEYGDPQFRGQALILQGEPLDLEIGVVNFLPAPIAAAETDWLTRISVTLSRGDKFAAQRTHVASLPCATRASLLRNKGVKERDGYVVLDESGAQVVRCRFDPDEFALEGGIYTLEASWIKTAISSSTLRLEYISMDPSVIQLEVRDVLSEADALDRDLHLAHRAIDDGVPERAEEVANMILRRAPNSSSAYVVRGRARAEMHRCQQARSDWSQAALIIERRSDVANRVSQRMRDDHRARAAAAWRQKAAELPCR